MAWRNNNAGMTGSNQIPLGSRRGIKRESPVDDGYNPTKPALTAGIMNEYNKRGRSPVRIAPDIDVDAAIESIKHRKKRNRWGDATENKAAGLMGLPTKIMSNMTSEQLEAYTLHLRIEEISQKLRISDVVPADGDR